MNEEINVIIDYLKENNIISIILPIGLFFTFFHLFMKFIIVFSKSIKTDELYKDSNNEAITEPVIEQVRDCILSNENFIKF